MACRARPKRCRVRSRFPVRRAWEGGVQGTHARCRVRGVVPEPGVGEGGGRGAGYANSGVGYDVTV